MQNVGYLLAAFIVIWLLFFGYLFVIARRQKRLSGEIEALKELIEKKS